MTGNLLLTLGRLPKALDVARGFADLGWRVVVAEPFKRHLAGASRAVAQSHRVTAPAEDKQAYLADLRRIIAEEKIDLIVPVSEETMHVAFLRESLPANTRLFTMPPENLLRLHNKHGFAQQAVAWGLAVPETYALGDPSAQALVQSGPVVVKPVHSCSGRGVRLLPAGAALPAPDPAIPAIVQRCVIGAEYSSCSIAHEGHVASTVIYRAAQKSGSVAVAFERVEHPAIADWITRFIAAAQWTGFIAFDIILDEAGQWTHQRGARAKRGAHGNADVAVPTRPVSRKFAPTFFHARRHVGPARSHALPDHDSNVMAHHPHGHGAGRYLW